MLSSKEAGVDLHIVSWHVAEDAAKTVKILHIKANFVSTDWYASIPATRMLAKCNDWYLNQWSVNGISTLDIIDVKEARSNVTSTDYRVTKTFKFQFELKRKPKTQEAPSFLRKFNNLVIDEECE